MQCPKCQRKLNQKECADRIANNEPQSTVSGVYQFGICKCGQKLVFLTEDEETTVEAI